MPCGFRFSEYYQADSPPTSQLPDGQFLNRYFPNKTVTQPDISLIRQFSDFTFHWTYSSPNYHLLHYEHYHFPEWTFPQPYVSPNTES